MNMKKLTALLLAVLLVFGLAACAGSPAESNAKPGDTMTLQDILTSITKDVADLPDTETTALTKDNFEYYAFTAMPDGVEAIDADALINAVARTPSCSCARRMPRRPSSSPLTWKPT